MLFSSLLRRRPSEKVCLAVAGQQLTYGQLDRASDVLAKKLAGLIKKNDRIFVRLADPIKQITAFFAIVKAGGICVLAHAEMKDSLYKELQEKYQIKYDFTRLMFEREHEADVLPLLQKEDIFLGILSSGSTGTPKLILRDQQSWLGAFPWQSELFKLSCESRLYLTGSLAYSANLNACLHIFFTGGSVFISKSTMPKTWQKEIRENRLTSIFMVPANYRLLVKSVASTNELITSVVTGGAKLAPATAGKLRELFPCAELVEYYGASELGHVSYAKNNDLLKRPDSVGRLFPGVKVEILDEEIWVSSPYAAPGYRPKATVGDLGYLDADGYLVLLGRNDDLVNVAGIKVSCNKVAGVLKQMPQIEDALVLGIPDQAKGEKICALVVKKDSAVQAKEIVHFCRSRLDRFSCPQKIHFLDSLPLNSNGKADLALLKKIALED